MRGPQRGQVLPATDPRPEQLAQAGQDTASGTTRAAENGGRHDPGDESFSDSAHERRRELGLREDHRLGVARRREERVDEAGLEEAFGQENYVIQLALEKLKLKA